MTPKQNAVQVAIVDVLKRHQIAWTTDLVVDLAREVEAEVGGFDYSQREMRLIAERDAALVRAEAAEKAIVAIKAHLHDYNTGQTREQTALDRIEREVLPLEIGK